MNGLAEFLSSDALKKQLEPYMKALGIPDHAFTCEKYRKKKWANVTFLEHRHGLAFLQKHGTQQLPPNNHQGGRRFSTATSTQGSINGSINGSVHTNFQGSVFSGFDNGSRKPQFRNTGRKQGARRQARLWLVGNDVFCEISKSHNTNVAAGQPNPITLRGLKYAAEEKVNPTRKIEKEAAPSVFEVEAFSCGYNTFDGDRLVFVPEAEFQDYRGTAKFTKSTLLVKFSNGLVVRISNDTIVDLICSFDRILTMTLTEVPSLFRESGTSLPEIANIFAAMSLRNTPPRQDSVRARIESLNGRHADVVGQCLVYQLQVTGTDLSRRMEALSHHDALPFQRFDLVTQRTPPTHLGSFRPSMAMLKAELFENLQGRHLPFGILFQLQALAWNAYLHPGVVLELMRQLKRKDKADLDAGKRPISVGAMKMLFQQIEWPAPHGDPSHFKVGSILDLLRENDKKVHQENALQYEYAAVNQNQAFVHRVTVTPSRITLHGPELEANNRILRKYPNHHEYFLRVQFCDENGQDMNIFNPKLNHDEVWTRFKRILLDGIDIAGRRYSFLGFSHSSLRSHSAWVCISSSHIQLRLAIDADSVISSLHNSWMMMGRFRRT